MGQKWLFFEKLKKWPRVGQDLGGPPQKGSKKWIFSKKVQKNAKKTLKKWLIFKRVKKRVIFDQKRGEICGPAQL